MTTPLQSTDTPPIAEVTQPDLCDVDLCTHVAIGDRVLPIEKKSDEGNMKKDEKEPPMNSRQLCEYFQITPNQLYASRRKHNLPCYKPSGKPLYFKRAEVDKWLATHNHRF